MKFNLYKCIGLLLLLVLGACATAIPNTSIESMEGELPAGTGIVVAETLNNSTRITGPIKRWREIIIWKLDTSSEEENKTFTIKSLSHSLSTQAYMGAVPAGKYRVGMLFSVKRGSEVTYFARALAPPFLGTFEVKPGQVTNLGVILYQPFQDKGWHEESYPDYAISRMPSPTLWETSSKAVPEIRKNINSDLPILGWNPDKYDEVREQAVKLIKASTLPKDLHVLNDGSYLLSGLFGGMYSNKNGDWQNLSLKSHYEITDVAELKTGQLLLGSELGTLLLTDSSGANPQSLAMGDKLKHVVDIDKSSSGQVYVLTVSADTFEVFNFDSDKQALVLSKSFPKVKRGFWADAYNLGISSAISIGLKKGLAIYLDKTVHRYSEETGEWSSDSAPEFNTMSQQLDGYISGSPYSSWSGAKPLVYSGDDGLSWQNTKERSGLFGSISPVPTYRFADGELIRTGKGVEYKFFSGWDVKDNVPILATNNDGEKWDIVGGVPIGCENIANEASTDKAVYLLCANGAVMLSNDRGRTWVTTLEARLPLFDEFPEQLKLKYPRDEKK